MQYCFKNNHAFSRKKPFQYNFALKTNFTERFKNRKQPYIPPERTLLSITKMHNNLRNRGFLVSFTKRNTVFFELIISNETVFCLLPWQKIICFHGFRPYMINNVPKALKKLQFRKSFSRKQILIFIDFQKKLFLKTLKRLVLLEYDTKPLFFHELF